MIGCSRANTTKTPLSAPIASPETRQTATDAAIRAMGGILGVIEEVSGVTDEVGAALVAQDAATASLRQSSSGMSASIGKVALSIDAVRFASRSAQRSAGAVGTAADEVAASTSQFDSRVRGLVQRVARA